MSFKVYCVHFWRLYFLIFSRLKFDFLYFFVWKNQKTVITFRWGLLDDFWGHFWRLHFFDLFAAEIWFFVFLVTKIWKKYGGGTKEWIWYFFFVNRYFFWDIQKNCRHHHFFEQNTENFNRKGCLPGINWNLISKHKIRQYYGFCNRRFSVFHKKNLFHMMILALYQAYSKINFRWLFKLIIFFLDFRVLKIMKLSKKYEKTSVRSLIGLPRCFWKVDFAYFFAAEITVFFLFLVIFFWDEISEIAIL